MDRASRQDFHHSLQLDYDTCQHKLQKRWKRNLSLFYSDVSFNSLFFQELYHEATQSQLVTAEVSTRTRAGQYLHFIPAPSEKTWATAALGRLGLQSTGGRVELTCKTFGITQ